MPDGWVRTHLGELGMMIKARGGTKKDESSTGIPVVRYGELYTRHKNLIRRFYSFVPAEKAAAYTPLQTGDILFAGSGETLEDIGRAAAFLGSELALVGGDLILFRPTARLDSRFLGYGLNSSEVNAQKRRLGQGSSVFHIHSDRLESILLAVPPLREQKKIAAILSSVDEAIEAAQSVIDQLQVVKKAMMAELLTRGLAGRHTRFKQTEIGEVPEGWQTPLLDDVARRGSGHTPSKTHPEYWSGDIKWVSLTDSPRLDRLYLNDTSEKITAHGIANSSAVEHPAGTVILSRDGSRVGKSGILTAVMAVSQHFMAWTSSKNLDNHFLYWWLQHKKPEFARVAIGSTTNKTIGLPYFKAMRVPLPPIEEQRVIAGVLTSIELHRFQEADVVSSLCSLKADIMSVLLTGEVRVTPDEESVPEPPGRAADR